jgi:hypothetical protein
MNFKVEFNSDYQLISFSNQKRKKEDNLDFDLNRPRKNNLNKTKLSFTIKIKNVFGFVLLLRLCRAVTVMVSSAVVYQQQKTNITAGSIN